MTEIERALIAGCVRGEKASWNVFVDQYSALVYHTIRKTFASYHSEPKNDLIDDLFQEFFLAIIRDDFKKLRQFRGDRGCTLASWISLVAARLTIDELRKRVPSTSEASLKLLQAEDSTHAPELSETQVAALSVAIGSLPPKDRLLIQFVFGRNLPPQSVARLLRTTVPAVYTQKSRILSKLRDFLK